MIVSLRCTAEHVRGDDVPPAAAQTDANGDIVGTMFCNGSAERCGE